MPSNKTDGVTQVNRIYNRGLLVLSREVNRLAELSIAGKLSHANGQDLVQYLKLLESMKEAQQAIASERAKRAEAAAKSLPDDELVRLTVTKT